ncbi:hypothetical protein EYC98_20790 [Halieaceae bacterium IMCC14734]|uniref:Sulfotransferase family protein n=1 Tax=Candidatus Litorirhabdus singularis TaxID=2518993 RepID=A0ABT3TLU4_9GAMM|nr:hypothetical protein [Candidatus Litorirhabdus singularis]MCX2983306.1 hypothetical protein [Candidatus Litorirhabdus singularis]
MTNPRVYIHIGMNKTASSTLQSWLNSQGALLKERGLLYPDFYRHGDAHYPFSSTFNFGPFDYENRQQKKSELKDLLCKEIRQGRYNKIVWSSEYFINDNDVAELKCFFEDYECKVVIYLRRHDFWWQSRYAQALKFPGRKPYARGLEAFIQYVEQADHYSRYADIIDRWEHVFGRENILVRPLEKEQNRGGVVADFLQTIEFEPAGINTEAVSENRALSNQACYILDLARSGVLTESEYVKLSYYLQANDPFTDRTPLLSPEQRLNIVQRCQAAQYSYIAKKYLGRKNGELFYAPIPDLSQDWVSPAPPSEAEIQSIFLQAQMA